MQLFHAQESGITSTHFHDNNLSATVMNLIVAGSETTSTTLRWGLLFMAKFPQMQGKYFYPQLVHINWLLEKQIANII